MPSTPPITPIATPTNSLATTTPSANASTVRIDAPAGQYRPGGTSTYPGAASDSDRSRLPADDVTPAPSAAPLPSNVPIYPAGNVRTY